MIYIGISRQGPQSSHFQGKYGHITEQKGNLATEIKNQKKKNQMKKSRTQKHNIENEKICSLPGLNSRSERAE